MGGGVQHGEDWPLRRGHTGDGRAARELLGEGVRGLGLSAKAGQPAGLQRGYREGTPPACRAICTAPPATHPGPTHWPLPFRPPPLGLPGLGLGTSAPPAPSGMGAAEQGVFRRAETP